MKKMDHQSHVQCGVNTLNNHLFIKWYRYVCNIFIILILYYTCFIYFNHLGCIFNDTNPHGNAPVKSFTTKLYTHIVSLFFNHTINKIIMNDYQIPVLFCAYY